MSHTFPQETNVVHVFLVRSNEFRLTCPGKHRLKLMIMVFATINIWWRKFVTTIYPKIHFEEQSSMAAILWLHEENWKEKRMLASSSQVPSERLSKYPTPYPTLCPKENAEQVDRVPLMLQEHMLVVTDDLWSHCHLLCIHLLRKSLLVRCLRFHFFSNGLGFYQGFSVFPTVSNDVFNKNAF